ncbi:MAG TPA: hypothetical protein VMD99_07560 [Terriglobales bacterium]|nr:hypothetical protein [Terriglobales bacterium]
MRTFGPQWFFFLFLLAAAITLACGSSQHAMTGCGSVAGSNTTGSLQSVSVCPATADAQQYSDGEVPFAAVGVYSTQPSPASLTAVVWGVCQQGQPTDLVTVTETGVAKCGAGASGTYTVWATGTPVCNVVGPCGACGPTGKAELTCP